MYKHIFIPLNLQDYKALFVARHIVLHCMFPLLESFPHSIPEKSIHSETSCMCYSAVNDAPIHQHCTILLPLCIDKLCVPEERKVNSPEH